jgi:signal peptidase I
MLPTLQISDHIFVNKFTYGPHIPFSKGRLLSDLPPKRGDVIVFEFPDEEEANPRQNFIKRAMAIPGDILETNGGHPILNGWEVPYCRVGHYSFDQETGYPKDGELFVEFLNDQSYLTLYEHYSEDEMPRREGPYVVKEGEFWVLGDNRNSSSDSRRWRQGRGAGVPFENVKGRAMFVWLSFNDLGEDALGVTWDRLLTDVMGKPRLPKEASPELKKGIQRCLAERPKNTTPPEPSQAKLQAARPSEAPH